MAFNNRPKRARIVSVRPLECNRCGRETSHTLYNSEDKTYRCNMCGTVRKLK